MYILGNYLNTESHGWIHTDKIFRFFLAGTKTFTICCQTECGGESVQAKVISDIKSVKKANKLLEKILYELSF